MSINFSNTATSGTLSVKANNACRMGAALRVGVIVYSQAIPQNVNLDGPMTINSAVTYLANKSIVLTPTVANPVSITNGAIFLAKIITCNN